VAPPGQTVESMSIEVMRLLQLAVHRPYPAHRGQFRTASRTTANRSQRERPARQEDLAVRSAGNRVARKPPGVPLLRQQHNEVRFMAVEEPRRRAARRGSAASQRFYRRSEGFAARAATSK